jgi:hypothetical protein
MNVSALGHSKRAKLNTDWRGNESKFPPRTTEARGEIQNSKGKIQGRGGAPGQNPKTKTQNPRKVQNSKLQGGMAGGCLGMAGRILTLPPIANQPERGIYADSMLRSPQASRIFETRWFIEVA